MNARFSKVIEAAGRPETYLPLVDPKKDRTLQKLVKSNRVMTVHQNARGGKPDYGEAGFAEGTSRQYLVFPKSIRRFARKRVVGIKYGLFKDAPAETSKKPEAKPKSKKTKPGSKAKADHADKPEAEKKIVAFPKPEKEEDNEEIAEIKTRVRKAMKALEDGKEVAAFNLLKQIVEA